MLTQKAFQAGLITGSIKLSEVLYDTIAKKKYGELVLFEDVLKDPRRYIKGWEDEDAVTHMYHILFNKKRGVPPYLRDLAINLLLEEPNERLNIAILRTRAIKSKYVPGVVSLKMGVLIKGSIRRIPSKLMTYILLKLHMDGNIDLTPLLEE